MLQLKSIFLAQKIYIKKTKIQKVLGLSAKWGPGCNMLDPKTLDLGLAIMSGPRILGWLQRPTQELQVRALDQEPWVWLSCLTWALEIRLFYLTQVPMVWQSCLTPAPSVWQSCHAPAPEANSLVMPQCMELDNLTMSQ